MFYPMIVRSLTAALLLTVLSSPSLSAAERLFPDPVVAKGTGFQVLESEVDEAFSGFKAARAAMSKPMPPVPESSLRREMLDKIVATRLLLARATPTDREEGKKMADKLIADTKAQARSEKSFQMQLTVLGTTVEKYEQEVLNQATVKAVIDRELKNKEIVSDLEAKKYYDEHPNLFQEPEKARVQHILFTAREIPSGEPLPQAEVEKKRAKAEALLKRIRTSHEDFAKLVAENSEEPLTDQKKGDLVIRKGENNAPPSFEAAAFSLKPGQVSDLVTSPFGFHIIKLIEITPASTIPLDKVVDRIRDRLKEQRVQAKLPDYLKKLREEAKVEILMKSND
jgi:parvulin-like peptidyl-prolyl isomerase